MLKRKKKSLPNANSNDLHTAQLTTKCTLRTIHILRQQKDRMGSKYDSFWLRSELYLILLEGMCITGMGRQQCLLFSWTIHYEVNIVGAPLP